MVTRRAHPWSARKAARALRADGSLGRRNGRRSQSLLGRVLLPLFLACFFPDPALSAQDQPDTKRVLILYSFENGSGLYADFDEALRSRLNAGPFGRCEFFTEFLDLARFPSPRHEKELQTYLRIKYSRSGIDLIVPVSLPAIRFVRSYGQKLFPSVPVVFGAVDRRWVVRLPMPSNMTGIVETAKITETLAAALQLQPDTRQVVLVGGTLPYEKDWMQEIRSDLQEYEGKLQFTYLTDLPTDQLSERLAHLPDHSIVLYMMLWRDGAGRFFLPREALNSIVQSSRAPVYGVFERYLGSGIVGGDVVPFRTAGAKVGELGLRVLQGTKPADIPVLSEDSARDTFDWRQLRRWQISEERLPPGSIVLFKQPSAWELYKVRIIGAIVLIAIEALLIIYLLVQRRRRRRAEQVLLASETRFLSLYEGMMEAFVQSDLQQRLTGFNEAFCQLVGYARSELVRMTRWDLIPEKWRALETEVLNRQVLAQGYSEIYEQEYRRKDGSIVPVEVRAQLLRDEAGRPAGMWWIVRNITERKKAEQVLREYERVVENSNDMIAMIDQEYRYRLANHLYLEHFGMKWDEVLGHSLGEVMGEQFFQAVVKERIDDCFRGQVVHFEATHQAAAGDERDLSASYYPVRNSDGVERVCAVLQDVTERRKANEALRKAEEKRRGAELSLREHAAFNELMTAILFRFATCSPAEVDTGVVEALHGIAEFVGADHAFVIWFSTDGNSWGVTHEWCGSNLKLQGQAYQRVPFGTLPWSERRLLAGEPVRINSLADYPPEAVDERRLQQREGNFSELTVPIRSRASIRGCIGLHSHAHPVAWSGDDLARLRALGDAVASALERKQSVEDLQKSEQKFSQAFHGSPIPMTILSLGTGRYLDVNEAYVRNTGYSAGEIIGRSPEELGIYRPPDLLRLRKVVATQMHLTRYEAPYRTRAGEERSALLSTATIEVGGEPCLLKVIEDITDRKRAEKTLRDLGSRMLMVQEDERRRVARDLHDDFSQRLALLAIDLEQLAQRPPATRHEWSARIQAMWAQTQELTSDVHRLSHQLHPSKLEDLGLVMAVRSHCAELSKQAGVSVRFLHAGVPRSVPGDVALCLYRIVQESLRNVVKHSGSETAVVELHGVPKGIELRVSDSGRGFDPTAPRAREGIGLIGMRERVLYVGGELSIQSSPSEGTRVEVQIPLAAPIP